MGTELHFHHKDNWCTFCDELYDKPSSNFRRIVSYEEIPRATLAETEHFFVVPGLGPMEQCYLLILPKASYTSIASLPPNLAKELMILKSHVRKVLSSLYDGLLMFEHGPAVAQSLMAGCCVEHAHIHIFAVKVDLLGDLWSSYKNNIFGIHKEFQPREISSHIELYKWIEQGVSYIWYEADNGQQWGFPLMANIQSQYMRRVLSEKIGLSDPQWDWMLFPGKKRIIETWFQLSKYLKLDIIQ